MDGLSPERLNWYRGIRDQDGWETLELTIQADPHSSAMVEKILKFLEKDQELS
jgi:hypothetical protein